MITYEVRYPAGPPTTREVVKVVEFDHADEIWDLAARGHRWFREFDDGWPVFNHGYNGRNWSTASGYWYLMEGWEVLVVFSDGNHAVAQPDRWREGLAQLGAYPL